MGVMYYNNLACIYLQVEHRQHRPPTDLLPRDKAPAPQMNKLHLASLYLSKALAMNEAHTGRTNNLYALLGGGVCAPAQCRQSQHVVLDRTPPGFPLVHDRRHELVFNFVRGRPGGQGMPHPAGPELQQCGRVWCSCAVATTKRPTRYACEGRAGLAPLDP